MLLVDIGNRFAHLYDGQNILNLEYEELFQRYSNNSLYYINVNLNLQNRLSKNRNWINLEPFVKLDGTYKEMGIDRKVLLLSGKDGIYIDAGSAITIDLKVNNKFIGGTILPGIWRVKECYKDISPLLSIDTLNEINLNKIPNSTTKDSISYGIIAPIVALVKKINKNNLPIYCCGGDGKLLAKYLGAKFDKFLIFKGMQNVIKEIKC